MHPIQSFVRNPVKVTVGVLIVALFGGIALSRMPMQLTPEVETPTISLETRWPGASPREVEKEIIREQEEQLKGVEGVTKMTSESRDSSGSITLEFRVGTDMEEALLKVNSRLQQVQEYPEDADEPVIRTSSSSDRPIAWFILSARYATTEQIRAFQKTHPEVASQLDGVLAAQNPGLAELRLRRIAAKHPEVDALLPQKAMEVPKLRKFAEDIIEARFERVPGVSDSNVLGGRDPELQVVVDPHKLAARRLTINDVRLALRSQNKDTSAGDLWEGKRRYVVRTLGQFRSPEQVAQQILAVRDGSPTYVSDVAEVRLGYKKPDGFVRRFGSTAIAINCVRDTGANVLSVMSGLREATTQLNEGVLKQQGLTLTQVYDETNYIYSAVGLVNQNIILGGALTVIVLMLFLHLGLRTLIFIPLLAASAVAAIVGNPLWFGLTLILVFLAGIWFARGALVISLAIPISIIGTFLIMHSLGRSLNVISLAGLAFAVGMLVDNAVVVLENIYRHHQEGAKPFDAAERGAREVWGAVVASTLTTLAVFVPVLFVEEVAGQLFRDIALAISSAVGLSLIVSITVIPTASARLMQSARETRPSRLASWLQYAASGFSAGVVGLNRWLLRSWLRRLVVVALLVGAAIFGSIQLWPKVEYLPTGNRNLIICIILPPPGYNLEQLMQMGQIVEDTFQPYWDVDPDSPAAKKLDYPVIADFFYVARGRSVFLGLRSSDPARVDQLIDLIGKLRPKLPGTIVVANKSSLFGRGLSAGRTIDIEITGPELTRLVQIGGRILGEVGNVVNVERRSPTGEMVRTPAQARPVPSLDLSSPEVHVTPRALKSRDMGFSSSELGYAVNALIDGAYVTDYFMGGDKIDLTIMGAGNAVDYTQDIGSLPIATPAGQVTPISSLAIVTLDSGPEQINHRERQRAVTIQVTPPAEIALEDAIDRVKAKIVEPLLESGDLGPEYTITLSGTADKLRETWLAMRWNLLIALLITYLLMAALFESWRYPLVIILSVPLGAVGGILGLRALSSYLVWQGQPPQTLDVLTMLGFVILIGTVVNNAILIVHQSLNLMRHDGFEPQEAILESVRTRIRPIFMTTATTVLGLSPLVFFPGAGSELYRGLGAVVLGGLLVSTLFTLVLVPTLFSLAMDIGNLLSSLIRRRRGRSDPEDTSEPTPPPSAKPSLPVGAGP